MLDVPGALEAASAAVSTLSSGMEAQQDAQSAAAAAAAVVAARETGLANLLHSLGLVDLNPLQAYDMALRNSPLTTKVVTAASLALAGDAFAQALSQRLSGGLAGMLCNEAEQRMTLQYDAKRGLAFALFGASYTGAFQSVWFDFLNNNLVGLGVGAHLWGTQMVPPPSPEMLAAVKVAINQFVVIPLLYMPLFFAFTGAMAELNLAESIERMRSLYASILKRNYAFWLPVQFFVFFALPQDYQVPLLSAASLIWTVILSSLGSSKAESTLEQLDVPPNWLGPSSLDELSVTVDELTDSVTLEDITDAVGASDGAQAALVVAGIAVASSAGAGGEVGGAVADAVAGALEEGCAKAVALQEVLEAQAIPIALALGGAGEVVTSAAEGVVSTSDVHDDANTDEAAGNEEEARAREEARPRSED